MRYTMEQIKARAAKNRSELLDELVAGKTTIYELAEKYGISTQAMGQKIKKARADRSK